MGWGSTVLVQLVHRDTPTLHNSAGDVEAIHRALPPYLGHNSQGSSIGFVCHTVHRVTPPLNMLLHMLLHIFGLVSSFRYHHLQGMQVKLDRHASRWMSVNLHEIPMKTPWKSPWKAMKSSLSHGDSHPDPSLFRVSQIIGGSPQGFEELCRAQEQIRPQQEVQKALGALENGAEKLGGWREKHSGRISGRIMR